MEIYDGALNVPEVLESWYKYYSGLNFGAIVTFVGVVRDENSIDGLSFDIYEPLLKKWFNNWQEKAKRHQATCLMAHSRGDVPIHSSSYIAAVLSVKRRTALELIDEFVEDFKKNAPIWKYDLIDGKRIYAKERSQKIYGAGLLAR